MGQTVTLTGWVHSRRDLGGVIFIDIRDREGRTQTVYDPSDLSPELCNRAASLRGECVVAVTGKVRRRPEGTNNPKIATGEVEVLATDVQVLNQAEVLPFPVELLRFLEKNTNIELPRSDSAQGDSAQGDSAQAELPRRDSPDSPM